MNWYDLLSGPATMLQVFAGQIMLCVAIFGATWLLLSRMNQILDTSLRNQGINLKVMREDATAAEIRRARDTAAVQGVDEKLETLLRRPSP